MATEQISDGKRARLIPTEGRAELRATSALLATLELVRPFSIALLGPLGGSKSKRATVTAFTEPTFNSHGRKRRLDGWLLVSQGSGSHRSLAALVETKVGNNKHTVEQINNYLTIAREDDFDCLITISNKVSPAPGVHPTKGVESDARSATSVCHLSWLRVLAVARETLSEFDKGDSEGKILEELIHFLENKASQVLVPENMSRTAWNAVRAGARRDGLRKGNKEATIVAREWDQVLALLSIKLGSFLKGNVTEVISRKEQRNHSLRTLRFAEQLTDEGKLSGVLRIPNAAGDLEVCVDVGRNLILIKTAIDAPEDKTPRACTTWLLRQFSEVPARTLIRSYQKGKSSYLEAKFSAVEEDPSILLSKGSGEIVRFEIETHYKMKSKSDEFIGSVQKSVERFYEEVLGEIQKYQPRPTSVRRR
jgi:hypothetical protein